MAAARTPMEAPLEATMASLKESRALLASCAQRLGVKEREGEAARTTSFASSASPLFVPGRVPEQPSIKYFSSSTLSAHRVMADGALQEGADLTTITPIRCSTVGSVVNGGGSHAVITFPTSGTKHLADTTWTEAGNSGLEDASGTGMNTRTGCSTDVLTNQEGYVAGAHVIVIDQRFSNCFPRFDGTNPGLWRVQCLEYFNSFNISKCLWVIAATMHMDGKAKFWYEAYRLRQAVGDWPEFIDDVEKHFSVRDLPLSTKMLGSAHSSGVVNDSGDISTEIPNSSLPVSPKEVLVTTAEPTEPTLNQLVESIKLQFVQLKLALNSEYEERKKKLALNSEHLGAVTQMSEPIADPSEEVLTHVSGVSLFLEPWVEVEPAETVCSETTLMELVDELFTCVGGSSLFLELDVDSGTKVFEVEVLTCVGDCSIFLEPGMGEPTEAFAAPSNGYLDKILDHGACVPSNGCKLQQPLSQEKQQYGTNGHRQVLPWDPGKQEAVINGLFGLQLHAETGVSQCNLCVVCRSTKDSKAMRLTTDHLLNKIPAWGRGGFSPGHNEQTNARIILNNAAISGIRTVRSLFCNRYSKLDVILYVVQMRCLECLKKTRVSYNEASDHGGDFAIAMFLQLPVILLETRPLMLFTDCQEKLVLCWCETWSWLDGSTYAPGQYTCLNSFPVHMSHFVVPRVCSWAEEQWILQGIHENNQSRDSLSCSGSWACIAIDRAFFSKKPSSHLLELSMPWDPGGIHETSISQAIAWGQAIFCEGGSVTPITSGILGLPVMGHGPAALSLGVAYSATRREQQEQ